MEFAILKCADKEKGMEYNSKTENKDRNAKNISIIFMLFLTLILGLSLGYTYSVLSASKTATGVISISMPPNVDMASSHLFLETSGSISKVYIGSDINKHEITANTERTMNVFLSDAKSGNSAYVRLQLIFYGADITYKGANSLAFVSKSGNTLSTTLNYKNTTISDGNTIMLFESSGAVPQYSSIFLDKVLSGVACASAVSTRVLEIEASTSYNSDYSASFSSKVYINYSADADYGVTTTTGTEYSFDNFKVDGVTASDLSNIPYGSQLTFDISLEAGYDGTAPLVQLKNGSTILTELNPTTQSGNTYNYRTTVQNSFSIAVQATANTYKIKFAGNGSTNGSMADMTCTYGQTYNLPENAFSREYTITYDHNYSESTNTTATATYSFVNWSASSGGIYANSANISNLTTTHNQVITMTAQWSGGSVTLPTPTRDGYQFLGWYSDSDCATLVGEAGATYTLTANTTLYAMWKLQTRTLTIQVYGYARVMITINGETKTYSVPNNEYIIISSSIEVVVGTQIIVAWQYWDGGFYYAQIDNGDSWSYIGDEGITFEMPDKNVTIYAHSTSSGD